MPEITELSANDLAAMLCSKVCHDLISPVGAIGNGLEVLADPAQADMAQFAQELITNAARQSRAKLEFARLAYGASSAAGTDLDLRECERVARLLVEVEKPDLDWQVPPMMMPKNKGKLLLQMLQIGLGSVPRGGTVRIATEGPAGAEAIIVTATGTKVLMPAGVEAQIFGTPPDGVSAREIQPFYTGLLARLAGMTLDIGISDDKFYFKATPAAAAGVVDDPAPASMTAVRSAGEPFAANDEKSA